MKSLIRLLIKSQQKPNQSELNHSSSGFTLIELLVAMIMTFLILTPLLAFVVDVLNTDRKEQVKTNTEQDMQAAVDFITQDLSQAVYIYDKDGINALTTGTFIPNNANQVPILVFWKRRLLRDSIPVTVTDPKDCKAETSPGVPPGAATDCDDTYVSSLVAYYQFKEQSSSSIWCQPSSSAANCPTRIVRYEVKDGLRNPEAKTTDTDYPYYDLGRINPKTQKRDDAFNKKFDLSKPTEEVTTGEANVTEYHVLVNNIDQSTVGVPSPIDCKNTLNVKDPAAPAPAITNASLLISDNATTNPTNSFYACVDKSRNLARIYLRGNAMRRMDPNAKYSASNPAFFPTATAQIQGLSSPGQ